jgi:tRNA(adenine34) deaminase
MAMAVEQAREAYAAGEVPVGAILVDQSSGQVIARARNRTEEDCDPTSHAEMACIRHASKVLGRWRLLDCALYVTLEPCPMCAGAILQSRLGTVVYGAPNKLLGADGSWIQMLRGRQSPALSSDDGGCQSKGTNGCTTIDCKEEFTQPQAYQQIIASGINRSNIDSNRSGKTYPISAADTKSHPFHPNIDVRRGVLEEECAQLMRMFFKQRRLSSNPDV